MNVIARCYQSVARALAELSPRCKTVSRLQSEALDRELSFRERTGVRVHLLLCKWCRRYGNQIRMLKKLVRERGDQTGGDDSQPLSKEARERIREKLKTIEEQS